MIVKNKNLKIAGILVIGSLLCTAGGIAAYTSDADEGAETAVNYATYLKAGGAAVRLKDVNAESIHNGIRFISLIDAEKYAELEALETNDTDTVKVDYGMTIVPYDYIAKYGELNKENLFGKNAKYYIDGITEKEEGKTMLGGCIYETLPAAKNPVDKAINLSIVNLPEKQLVREFIGVAFIRITTNNVAEYYVGGYTQEETRSMAYVTQAALNDTNSTLTEDQKSFLQTNYLDNVNVKDQEYTYSTEHIFVDLSGKETLQETVAGEKTKIGATVTATPNSYEWYEYDEDSSVNTGIVYANNRTVLKLYYKEKLSSLSLGEGVVTADGKAEYAKDSVVTLKHTGTIPQGTVFDGFKVDGERIAGETFTINKTSHVIEAVYATAETMTWGTSFTDASTLLPSAQVGFLTSNNITAFTAGASKNWALSFDVTGGFNADEKTNQKFGVSIYFGNTRTFEFQVNGSAGNYTGNFKHYGNGNYNQIGQLSGALVQKIVNASEENPVHLDAVRLGDYMYVYVNGEYFYTVTIPGLTMYGDYFGYAWRVESKDVTTQPQIKNAKAVVGEERATLAFERFSPLADITFENEVTAEKESYRIGETVTLTAAPAEAGMAFSHFTVDGKRIDGNTFVVTKSRHTVEAVYLDVSETYYIDVEETSILFSENGEVTIPAASLKDDNGDVVEGYTVTALVTDAYGNTYSIVDGIAKIGYKGAITLTIAYSCDELEGKDKSITVVAQGKDGTVLSANEFGASLIMPDAAYATVGYSEEQKCETIGDAGSIKLTMSQAKGNQDYAFFKFDFADYDYVEFYAYTTGAGKQVGACWYGDTNLTANTWTKVVLRLRASNVNTNGWRIRLMGISAGDVVYLSSMKLVKHNYDQAILDASKGTTFGTWSTEKTYDGDNAAVDKTGALKLTPDSDDYNQVKVNAAGVNVRDMVGLYSEVYFYVYTDVEGAQAGTTWCGDTNLVAGQWTKITITSDKFSSMNGAKEGGYNMGEFRYRIMKGNGGTFYVTSLYGTPISK